MTLPGADLNLLTALDARLVEASVAGAARRLELSASAMSCTLARLRAATGDPLLVRACRSMVSTTQATELRERMQALSHDAHAVPRPVSGSLKRLTLKRSFTIRANEGFVEIFAGPLVAAINALAPKVRLRFAPKPDKDVRALREGIVDLEIGVLGGSDPEVRLQAMYRDDFGSVVRAGHPLLESGEIIPGQYAVCGHVVASRRGRNGPVDNALAHMGLTRKVVAIVPGFRAALAIAAASDLGALVTSSFVDATQAATQVTSHKVLQCFALPVKAGAITIFQRWHPRLDAEQGHRWLRSVVRPTCQEQPWVTDNARTVQS